MDSKTGSHCNCVSVSILSLLYSADTKVTLRFGNDTDESPYRPCTDNTPFEVVSLWRTERILAQGSMISKDNKVQGSVQILGEGISVSL